MKYSIRNLDFTTAEKIAERLVEKYKGFLPQGISFYNTNDRKTCFVLDDRFGRTGSYLEVKGFEKSGEIDHFLLSSYCLDRTLFPEAVKTLDEKAVEIERMPIRPV